MKAFLYCETTDGGMLTHFYYEHQLENLHTYLLTGLGRHMGPNDKAYRQAMEEDKNLLKAAEVVEVGTALPHRLGVLIRLKDDHQLVS